MTYETTVVMNATSMGLSNLSTQTGTLGTIFGATLVVALIVGVVGGSHSWNTKGWLYKLVKWLVANVGENVLYGLGTTTVVGGVYYVGSEISKFGESNPHFLNDLLVFCGESLLVVAGLAILGYISKPVWNFVGDYALGKKKKEVR